MAAREGARPALVGNIFDNSAALELPPEVNQNTVREQNFILEAGRGGGRRPAPSPAGGRNNDRSRHRKIGKYGIIHKLGRGGMADVYLAQDTERGARGGAEADRTRAPMPIPAMPSRPSAAAPCLQAHLAAIDPRVVRIYESGDSDGYLLRRHGVYRRPGSRRTDAPRPARAGVRVDVAIAVAETLEHAHTPAK